MNIKLNYYKSKPVDLNDYYDKYLDTGRRTHRLLQGAPILVNVEGTYIYADDIPKLVVDSKYITEVDKWLSELRNPQIRSNHFTVLNFRWKRGD